MARTVIALGAFCWLAGSGVSLAQMTGSWRPSPPNSKAIIYDEKGRRLYWDENGQIIGRYSFATGKYIAELPGRQREEKLEANPNSPKEKQREMGIVFWGRAPKDSVLRRPRPKIISGPPRGHPTIVRHNEKSPDEDIAGTPLGGAPSSVSVGPEEMPYFSIY